MYSAVIISQHQQCVKTMVESYSCKTVCQPPVQHVMHTLAVAVLMLDDWLSSHYSKIQITMNQGL